jgi:hypothetical protein
MDPASFGQCPQAAGTGGEDVITAGGRARHGGINRIAAAAAGQQHSRPAAMGRPDRHDTVRRADGLASGLSEARRSAVWRRCS